MYVLPFWKKEIGILFFNIVPTKLSHLSSHETSLLIPASKNSVPCSFNHTITVVITLSSLLNLWPEEWSWRVGKRWKTIQHQIWAVWRMFRGCPPELLQELLCCSHNVGLSIIAQKQNTCCEHSRALWFNGCS
jgi:hypothetical protein